MENMEKTLLVDRIKKYINEKYGSLDYFTEQQLVDYCLGKAEAKKSQGKVFKIQDVNCEGIIKYLQTKKCMSYDLITESANRLAVQYARLAKTSAPSSIKKIDEKETADLVQNKINLYYLNGNLDSHVASDGKTITYETIEPVA